MSIPSKKKQVHHYTALLQAFHIKPFPPSTATELRQIVNGNRLLPEGKPMSQRSAESRLCELVRYTLVDSYKFKGDRFTRYAMNERGLRVITSGAAGQQILRQLAVRHGVHEKNRADELAPIKEKWTHRIETDLYILAHGLLP